jgi:hypothetical protein
MASATFQLVQALILTLMSKNNNRSFPPFSLLIIKPDCPISIIGSKVTPYGKLNTDTPNFLLYFTFVISYQLSIPIVQLSYTIYNNVIHFELEHKSVCYYIPSFKVVPIEKSSIIKHIPFQIKFIFYSFVFICVH